MRRYLLTLAAVAALATTSAHAEEAAYLGYGVALCSTITQLYRKYPTHTRELDDNIGSWASGFMTGANLIRGAQGQDSQNLAAMPVVQQVIAIRRYCKHNPNRQMMEAVVTLFIGFSSNVDAGDYRQEKLP